MFKAFLSSFDMVIFVQHKRKNNKVSCPVQIVLSKVRPFLEHSCAILSSFKIVIIFNITSAEIKTKSADVLSEMITILKELRIAQLFS